MLVGETGLLTVTNAIFSNNSGNFGGAIMNDTSTVSLVNDTFSGNTADNGGGLAIFDGDFNIFNTIIVLVCAESDNTLYPSLVALGDGEPLTSLSGLQLPDIEGLEAVLCGLGYIDGETVNGARFEHNYTGIYNLDVEIPNGM